MFVANAEIVGMVDKVLKKKGCRRKAVVHFGIRGKAYSRTILHCWFLAWGSQDSVDLLLCFFYWLRKREPAEAGKQFVVVRKVLNVSLPVKAQLGHSNVHHGTPWYVRGQY